MNQQDIIDRTNEIQRIVQSAKAPVIDKLEKALEINRELVEALEAILSSNAKPVFGIDGKTIKGFTIYLPYERYETVKQSLKKAKGDSR